MKGFEIVTETKYGRYTFLTKANNGKEALNGLISHSGDFKDLVGKQESDRMVITIKPLKTR